MVSIPLKGVSSVSREMERNYFNLVSNFLILLFEKCFLFSSPDPILKRISWNASFLNIYFCIVIRLLVSVFGPAFSAGCFLVEIIFLFCDCSALAAYRYSVLVPQNNHFEYLHHHHQQCSRFKKKCYSFDCSLLLDLASLGGIAYK